MGLLRREFVKLLFQKRTYFGWALFLLAPFLVTVAIRFSDSPIADEQTANTELFRLDVLLALNGLYATVVSLSLLGAFLLPMFAAMAGSQTLAGEAENGTLRSVLMQPVSRGALLMAKWVVANTYIGIAFLLILVSSLVAGGAFFGIRGFDLMYGPGVAGLGESFALIIQGYAFLFFGMMSVVSLTLLLSAFTNSALAAMAGGLGLVTVMIVLGNLPQLDFLDPYVFTAHFDTFLEFFTSRPDRGAISQGLINFAVWTALTTTGAWLVFRGKDIRS